MIDPLKAATQWYITLHSPDVCEADKLAFASWQAASAQNAQAWQRILQVNQAFEYVNPALSKAALQQRVSFSLGRRNALKNMGVILAAGGLSYTVYRQQPWQTLLADYSTAKGQTHSIALADNTEITLNTDTAINVKYSAAARQIELLEGEIYINTGHGAGSNAPFSVKTRDGLVTALGTRFSVRQQAEFITVNVFEGAVELATANTRATQRLQANQTATFSANHISPISPLPPGAGLWVKGILAVVNMPLKDFLAELSRYQPGILRCDNAIAHIAVSGSFPINNIPAIFDSLTRTYPVRMQTFTRYWLTFSPA